MKGSFYKAKVVTLVITAALMVVALAISGCADESTPGHTQVSLKISQPGSGGSAKAGDSGKIDSEDHPIVAVAVKVTAPDLAAPEVYNFTPTEVSSASGVLTMDVPSGKARLFTPMALEVYTPASSNVFPGYLYKPSTPKAERTVDLTGDPVTLNIDITHVLGDSISGQIRDDITGSLMPLEPCRDGDSIMARFKSPLFNLATPDFSVSASSSYTIYDIPQGLDFTIAARDPITGATGSASVNIPPGTVAGSTTVDLDLTGATPLSLSPQSATVEAGGTLTLTADGGIPPRTIDFTTNNSGAGLTRASSTSYLYTAGSPPSTVASVTDSVIVEDSCTHIAGASITVTWPALVISPANPSIGPGQDLTLSASGGNGMGYSWSITTQGCSGSTLSPSGTINQYATYNSGSSANCSDEVEVTDTAGTTPATATVTVGPFGVSLGSSSFSTEAQLGLSVNVALPAAGDKVRLEVIHDDNGNGTADASEPAVKIFEVTDGQGMDAYPRVPYDEDLATDGSITTSLPYYDPPHAAGSYILKATDLTNANVAENAFTITPAAKATYLSGTVIDGGSNPLPGALVALMHGTDGHPSEWSWTDDSGNFVMYSRHTENKADLLAFKDGYVWDRNLHSKVDMAALTPPYTVTLSSSDGTVISGTFTDEISGEPIPGVMAVMVSIEPFAELGYVAGDFSDASGAFSFEIVSGQSWWANVWPTPMVEHGYMLNEEEGGGTFCHVSSSITGIPATFVKADGYISGTVSGADAPAGMRIGTAPESGEWEEEEMYSVSTVDPEGYYYLPIKTGYDYWVGLHAKDLGENDVLALEGYVQASIGGPSYVQDLTIESPTAHITGTFTVNAASTGAPVGGVTVFADSDAGYDVEGSTDAAGNYTVPVNDGTWYLEPEESDNLMRMGYTSTFEGQLVYDISGPGTVTGADFTVNDSDASAVISGTIREEATGSILEEAWVIIDEWETGIEYQVIADTDAECGEYAIRLPTGEYKVSAYHDSYVNEYYPDSYDINAADSIFVGPPDGTYDPQVLDFYLDEGGSITGDVISWGPAVGGNGQPLPYVQVEAWGLNSPYPTAWGDGASDGSFKVEGLLSNDYSVEVTKEGFEYSYYLDAEATPYYSYTPVSVTAPYNTDLELTVNADILVNPTMCNNGLDDDGDGLIDMNDPGCDGIWDWDEENWSVACDDGNDNDGDTLVDMVDPGCAGPADSTETSSSLVCDNGLDDDGDTYTDWPNDPGCLSADDTSERDTSGTRGLICDDDVDNDGDTLADYPNDPDCTDIYDLEATKLGQCSNNDDDDGDTYTDGEDVGCSSGSTERIADEICDDGIDNDGDGYLDSFDPGCSDPSDTTETSSSLVCDDGIDNDGDGYTDYPDDPGCASPSDTTETSSSLVCDDGIDNDGDGYIDMNDWGCINPWSSVETHAQYPCDDGVDNDGDTLTDWIEDPECQMVEDPWMCMSPGNELAGCGGAY